MMAGWFPPRSVHSHQHQWDEKGECVLLPRCYYKRLKSGVLVKRVKGKMFCNCECHINSESKPEAKWRVEHASRAYPQYTVPANRALCVDCYRDTQRADRTSGSYRYFMQDGR